MADANLGCAVQLSTSEQARHRSILLLVLAATLWSSSGLFVKVIEWSPMAILSGRGLLAGLVMLIYLRRPQIRLSWFTVLGALGYVGAQIFFVAGAKLTAVANVIFLTYTSPLYLIPAGYWLLQERPKKADIVAMFAIFAGMFLFLGDGLRYGGSVHDLVGNLYGVLGGVSMAVMTLSLRSQKDGSPANTILLGTGLAFLIGFPWLLQASFTVPNLGIILFLGIFQIGLSFVAYSVAIRRLEALESTLIIMLEPILNPLWVFLVLGEVPGPLALLGGILVLSAVVGRALVSAYTTVSPVKVV